MTLFDRLLAAAAAPVLVWLIRLLWASYQWVVVADDNVEDRSPLVLTLWHDSLFIGVWYFRRLSRKGVKPTYLVSPSKDGEYAVRILRSMGGARCVRGSATRSGVKAMHGLYRAIVRDDASPVVVPDGPHGPRRHLKAGPLMLAQLSGAPVLPIACAARRAWQLRTWDRLQIPCPFTRVAVVVGAPYTVPSGLGGADLEARRDELEELLARLSAKAADVAETTTTDVEA